MEIRTESDASRGNISMISILGTNRGAPAFVSELIVEGITGTCGRWELLDSEEINQEFRTKETRTFRFPRDDWGATSWLRATFILGGGMRFATTERLGAPLADETNLQPMERISEA